MFEKISLTSLKRYTLSDFQVTKLEKCSEPCKSINIDGLIAEYLFSNNFNDSSGNGYNLNPMGDITLRKWVRGYCVYYPSNLSGLHIGSSALTQQFSGRNTYTISFWVFPTKYSTSEDFEILKISSGYYNSSTAGIFILSNGKLRFRRQYFGNYADILSNEVVSLNKWSHIVCLYDGNTMKIYINGKFSSSLNTSLSVGDYGNMWFGLSEGWRGNSQPGYFDSFRIYNRALSDDEILQLSYEFTPKLIKLYKYVPK